MENARNVERLLFGFNKLDFLDLEWLHYKFKKADIAFEVDAGMLLKNIFPELPFPIEWLAQAWALYREYAQEGTTRPARELPFLCFILGLKSAWPMQTKFSRETWQSSMESGKALAKQMLMVVYIFHEHGGTLLS